MTSLRRLMGIIFIVSVVPMLANCAPDQAAKLRAEKSLTLGLPGVSYRPNGKVGIGVTGGAGTIATKIDSASDSGSSVTVIGTTSPTSDTTPKDGQRVVKQTYTQFSPFVQYFPWDTSAFFVGVGGTYQQMTSRFDEEKVGSTTLEPVYTPIAMDTKTTYVGVPVGWAWIWTPGFSLTLDFGPRFRVSRNSTMANDGAGDNVDAGKRQRTVDAIDSMETRTTYGGSGIIGWSF